MKIKKAIAGLASAIAMLGCIHTSAAADQLRFGIDPTFPPFESKNANGQLIGFDIDLGNAICAEMKVQCSWVQNSFDGLIPALQAKKFDAILSSLSIRDTPTRQMVCRDSPSKPSSAKITVLRGISTTGTCFIGGRATGPARMRGGRAVRPLPLSFSQMARY